MVKMIVNVNIKVVHGGACFKMLLVGCGCRQWGHSCRSGSAVQAPAGEGGHKADKSGEVPDQYGRAAGEHRSPRVC